MKSFAEAINTCRQGQIALRRDVKSKNVQFAEVVDRASPPGK
jgi:hypothetical protein